MANTCLWWAASSSPAHGPPPSFGSILLQRPVLLGAFVTALKSAFFDELSSCAVIPPLRNSAPAPAATQPAVFCQGRSAYTGDSAGLAAITYTCAGGAAGVGG